MAGQCTRRWCFALLQRGWPELEFLAARSLADPHWQPYRHGRTRTHFAGTRRSGPGRRCERSPSPAVLSLSGHSANESGLGRLLHVQDDRQSAGQVATSVTTEKGYVHSDAPYADQT